METIIVLLVIVALIYMATHSNENNSDLQNESSEKKPLLNAYREALKTGDIELAFNAFIDLFNDVMKIEEMGYLQKVNIAKDYAKELFELKSDVNIDDMILKMNLSKEKLLILIQIKESGILTDEETIQNKSEFTKESKFTPKKKPVRKSQA